MPTRKTPQSDVKRHEGVYANVCLLVVSVSGTAGRASSSPSTKRPPRSRDLSCGSGKSRRPAHSHLGTRRDIDGSRPTRAVPWAFEGTHYLHRDYKNKLVQRLWHKASTQVRVKYSATSSTTGPASSTSRVSPLGLQTEMTKATTDRRAPPQSLASAVTTLKTKGEKTVIHSTRKN